MAHVSTSYVERQNLTMRMGMRRFARLTNGFSKKVANLEHAVSLHFMHYNFCRIHKSLQVTPAMAAGVSDHAWNIEELVSLRDTLGDLVSHCQGDERPDCPIIESLAHEALSRPVRGGNAFEETLARLLQLIRLGIVAPELASDFFGAG